MVSYFVVGIIMFSFVRWWSISRHQIQLSPLDDKQNGFSPYHQMATTTILVAIRFGHYRWMGIEKGWIWQIPFYLFWFPKRMDDFKKYGHHPIVIISWMVTKVFSIAIKRGHATRFFENLLTTLDENFPKNMTTPLFW